MSGAWDRNDRDERADEPFVDRRADVDGDAGLFQPPDPRDLERDPPADPECRRVRGMLRDYVDDELPGGLRTEIEAHVHDDGCRACRLALGRAELEVVRLRDALSGANVAEPGPDFTSGVLARVTGMALSAGETPRDLTDRVMDRVRLEWRGGGQRSWSVARRRGVVAGVIAGAAALAIVWMSLWGSGAGRTDGRVRVGPLDGSRVVVAGRELRPGDAVPDGQALEVLGDGVAELLLAVGATNDGAGPFREHVARVFGSASAVVEGGSLRVGSGSFEILTAGGLEVGVSGHGDVALDRGRYWLDALPVRRFDRELGGLGEATLLRLETEDGSASLVAGEREPLVIGIGRVARFEPGAAPQVGASPIALLRARSRTNELAGADGSGQRTSGRSPSAGASGSFVGRVLRGSSDVPVVGATVQVRWFERDAGGVLSEQSDKLETDDQGRFRFGGADVLASFALVSVEPPAGAGVAALPTTPVSLVEVYGSATGGGLELRPILLDVDHPVEGVVRTPDGAALARAEVQALLVDELFGVVEPVGGTVWTGTDGRYRVEGLPDRLDAHQRLVVLAAHDDWAPGVRLGAIGRADALTIAGSADVVVRGLEPRTLVGLEADRTRLPVFFEIPGLPPSALVDRRIVQTDGAGRATVRAAAGVRAWVAEGARARQLAFAPEAPDGAVWSPIDEWAEVGRGSLELGHRAVPRTVRWTRGHRFERIALAGTGDEDASSPIDVVLLAGDGGTSLPAPPGTHLFLRDARGAVRYLGALDALGRLADGRAVRVPVGQGGELVAVSPEGAVGSVDLAGVDAASASVRVDLVAAGAARVDEPLYEGLRGGAVGDVVLEFRCTDGPMAGRSFWRCVGGPSDLVESIPAGVYDVTLPDGERLSVTVEPGAIVRLGR
jgi:hypothetical protein